MISVSRSTYWKSGLEQSGRPDLGRVGAVLQGPGAPLGKQAFVAKQVLQLLGNACSLQAPRGRLHLCFGARLACWTCQEVRQRRKKICPLKRGRGLYGAYQYVPCLRTERGYVSQKNGPAFAEPFEGRGAEPISLDARRLVRITGHCPLDRGHADADGGDDSVLHFSLSTRFTPRPVSGRSQRRCLRAPAGTFRLMRGV